MSVVAFAIVMLAAILHATWNAIVKGGTDTWLMTILVAGSASMVSLIALPFLPSPARASWPMIGASVVVHLAYFVLIANAYRLADMSRAYPLMRGTAPLLVAVASVTLLGETLPVTAWVGVGVICAGILGMAAGIRRGDSTIGVILALANAVVIALYTLIDGSGARRSGAPVSYALWIFLLTGVPLVAWTMRARRGTLGPFLRQSWPLGLVGGVGTVSSYGLVLVAMTMAPVPVVAALRETAILFGTAISGLVLKERVGPARICAVCVIAAGAMILRVA